MVRVESADYSLPFKYVGFPPINWKNEFWMSYNMVLYDRSAVSPVLCLNDVKWSA